jgi:hypothetical protein
MSVEETQQPSFTVTADIQREATGVSQSSGSRASESLNSYSKPNTGVGDGSASTQREEVESGSLRTWNTSHEKSNGDVGLETAGADGGEEAEQKVADEDNNGKGTQSQEEVSGNVDTSRESQSPGPDISTTPNSATRGSEGENIPSPTNTPPPTTSHAPITTPEVPARPPAANGNTDLQPINRYSPHKNNFIIPPPSSTKRSLFGRQRKSVIEKDSFAEDDPRLQKVRPVEKLKRMMERYDSTTSNREGGDVDGFNTEEMGVPAWEGVEMQPGESVGVEAGTGATDVMMAQNKVESSQKQEAVPAEEAIQSTVDAHAAQQTSPSSPPARDRSPSPANSTNSRSLSQSPPRRNGFNTLIESESSLGMPSEMNFTQEDDLEVESQHSTHSIPNIATQSLQHHRQSYLSSPPPSPPRESDRSHPTSTDPNGQSSKGTTQEATQLVTEDELIPSAVAESPPTFPARRVLPTARARLAGRDVISQPADRSRPLSVDNRGPHTIAAPGRLLARIAPVERPLIMEETFVDHSSQPVGGEGEEDVDMLSSERREETNRSEPSSQNQGASPPAPVVPVEATYVDPTLTSLPPPPPKRPTPVKYGTKAAPAKPVSPIPTPTPSGLASPPPTAGPSKSPPVPTPSPGDQPAPTKSGRIPKRKRRDSSATMSSSSSSSEDADMYDESYRPAVTVKPPVAKTKGEGKATNPNLKRVKQGTRSRSSSHTTSASTNKDAATTERSTPLTEDSEHSEPDAPDRPWVFACWYPNWFIGRVRGISQGKYDVDYEDGTHSLVAIDRVRKGVLESGDKVKSEDHKGEEFTVVEEWKGDERGIKVKGQSQKLKLSRVYIRQGVIKADFQNRVISPQDLGFDYKPPTVPRPLMNNSTKSISTTSDIFAGKIFFITSTSSASAANKNNQKDAATQIVRNGGKFVEKWYDLFDLPQSGFGSTLASTSAPFLIQETSQASLTPKALVSLAKGIPCLSMTYIQDVIADPTVSRPLFIE